MNIKDITYSHNNDFKAVFVCPICKCEFESWGYSDANFYNNVMPNAICRKCGKNSHGETEAELQKRLGRVYHI